MARDILLAQHIQAAAQDQIGIPAHQETIDEIKAAVASNKVVMVSMSQNPYPKKARKLLEQNDIVFCELSYGSYFSCWQQRLAVKMWSGWATLPMIFINGELIGGYQELADSVANNALTELLAN